MGVAGGFWELVKPVARYEDVEYLKGKKVSVDLSYWIVQQETALKGNARKPHLRVTFFRTVNLFAKLGVFPLFIVDGDAPILKSPTRLDRFCKMTGIDHSSHKNVESTIIARNPVFNRYIEECVELLELMGMPVLRAKGEAEALCAQLDREGWVDACLTADSDAFLHGAKCVIKCLRVDCKEQKRKEHNKWLHWQTKTFAKICATDGFPNNEIVSLYLGNETGALGDLQKNAESLSWQAPKMESLEDFLGHHLFWDRTYTRQKILPLCSLTLLRKMAANKEGVSASEESLLLYNRYVPHSVERIKVHYSQSFYVLKWKHVNSECNNDDWLGLKSKDLQLQKRKASVVSDSQSGCDEESHAVEVYNIKGYLFIKTDEDMELVRAACPKLVESFEYEKAAAKERKAAVSKCSKGKETSRVKQITITSYFKTAKGLVRSKCRETLSTVGDNQGGNTCANLTLPIPLEKAVERIKPQVPVFNDPVSQVS